jgi:hypothetical protein
MLASNVARAARLFAVALVMLFVAVVAVLAGARPAAAAAAGPPLRPIGLEVHAHSSDSVDISWADRSTNETRFEVVSDWGEIRNAPANSDPAGVGSFRWNGLDPGQQACFRVRAFNAAGRSEWFPGRAWQTYFCATTPEADPVPASPAGVRSVNYGTHNFQITWADRSSNEDGFEIHNGDEVRRVPARRHSYLWPARPGQYMCIKVRAYNSAGASDWSGTWTCTSTPRS